MLAASDPNCSTLSKQLSPGEESGCSKPTVGF